MEKVKTIESVFLRSTNLIFRALRKITRTLFCEKFLRDKQTFEKNGLKMTF